ncbi:MAG: ankyrin repeat domain-containing protein [Pseudomonadota bacterium]
MKSLPNQPDIDQLKRQAKELLAALRQGAPEAITRFQTSLPAAAGQNTEWLAQLRLNDAQSCLAREYGFASWAALSDFVDMARARRADPAELTADFARFAYAGDLAGDMNRSRPERAARYLSLLAEHGPLDPWIGCASGDVSIVRQQLELDPGWAEKKGGPLRMPPLVAATHSGLIRLPEYRDAIHEVVSLLLQAGADPNQSVGSRWPPASLEQPSQEHLVSALYGAAGVNHDTRLTRLLLDAGADPNDGEALYHALEHDDPDLVDLLLQAGATISGTNALYRALDYDHLKIFELLLSRTESIDEPDMGPLLIWAIRRRRSLAHIEAILKAGGDPRAKSKDGVDAFTLALRYGLPDVARLLQQASAAGKPRDPELFLAACARGDSDEARRLKSLHPDLPAALDEAQLRMFPELAAAGCTEAVRLMAELGWPLDIRGGDWHATVLNHAVFRGDAALVETLLTCGAEWTEEHGFGDNACGTLSWASLNQPVPDGDWAGCAKALLRHGMPSAQRDPAHTDTVLVAGVRRRFAEDVTEILLSGPAAAEVDHAL